MSLRISIFDDEDSQRREWTQKLEGLEAGVVETWGDGDFNEEVEKLEQRRRKARESPGGVETLAELKIDSRMDGIDILIVDYDLLHSSELTGEEIAYLLRSYSTCGLIVALNQFGSKVFDLTLIGHPESFADLNVGSPYFDDPGLWSSDGWNPFRPWKWPHLPSLHGAFEARAKELEGHMDQPILEFLELDPKRAGILPYATLEFIQGSKKAEETTFEDFVLRSGKGLRKKDAERPVRELLPRIAAARLHQWLETFVLGGQEVLVDAPHLVSRFPSLLAGSTDEADSWDKTARLDAVDGIDGELLRRARYPRNHWLSRPVWYWGKVRTNEKILEVEDPWSVEKHGWVFCEDSSAFCQREAIRSFVSDVPSNFTRRYVKRFEDIDYHPSVRFSL